MNKRIMSCRAVLLLLLLTPLARSGILFEDVTVQSGLNDLAFTWGASWGDMNADGYPDLLVAHHFIYHESQYTNIYLSNGDGTFRPRMQVRGDVHGGALGDLDCDGDLDMFICRGSYHTDTVWLNDGTGTFSFSPQSGILDIGRGRSSSMIDVDRDGDLDIFVTNKLTPNLLWENDGTGQFVETAAARGVRGNLGMNKGAVWSDYDGDGDPDLFVAVWDGDDFLWQNDGTGHFTDVAAQSGLLGNPGGMDACWADFNNDLQMDLFVCVSGAGGRHLLYINQGDGTFIESGISAGITNQDRARQCTAGDFDNDGFIDIYVTIFSTEDGTGASDNLLYRNAGNGTFLQVAVSAMATARLGYQTAGLGSVVSASDFDRDGRLDLFVTNGGHHLDNCNPGPNILLHNISERESPPEDSWCEVRLIGKGSNTGAIGAKVAIETSVGNHCRENMGGSHYCSQDEPLLHFGLGQAQEIRWIVIQWPDGAIQSLHNVSLNRLIEIKEP